MNKGIEKKLVWQPIFKQILNLIPKNVIGKVIKKNKSDRFRFHDKLKQASVLHSQQMRIHNFFDHENAFDSRYKTLMFL